MSNEKQQEQQTQDPAIIAVEERTELVVQEAAAIQITDQDSYQAAGAFLTEKLKPALAEVGEAFDDIVANAHATHKAAVAKRKKYAEPLKRAEQIIKGAMGTYHQEQQRRAAEDERLRLAAARKVAEDQAVEEAARLEREGKNDEAAARLEEPATPVLAAPPAEAAVPATAPGTSVRTKLAYRIKDESKIERTFMMPDAKKIAGLVRTMGADAERLVGGIEVYEEAVVSARSSR